MNLISLNLSYHVLSLEKVACYFKSYMNMKKAAIFTLLNHVGQLVVASLSQLLSKLPPTQYIFSCVSTSMYIKEEKFLEVFSLWSYRLRPLYFFLPAHSQCSSCSQRGDQEQDPCHWEDGQDVLSAQVQMGLPPAESFSLRSAESHAYETVLACHI